MNPKLICSGWFFLLLLLTHNQGKAKPMANVQALSKWLDEDLEQPLGSEETEQEQESSLLTGALEQDGPPFQWSRTPGEGMPLSESSFQRLFRDLLGSSRRYRGRSKKGLSRGCFGVKLDRIGTLSGLGC
ncbi:C-type natriuretic peptide 1-like [Hemicordylus capensis]|uniref:C-type natriuretic peptide 1-like n=1 Tax=Hemicordylus capensis TaxID=884348 RepID=UPI00230226DB|nr:C-type natriuretic peptide 1-like [Hemicordylus capensis]